MHVTFSVITPSYNSERFIAETIESVISQRGDFYIDYLVIDGFSTDGTQAILEKYKLINESGYLCNCLGVNYRYISEPDDGMYDALVKAIMIIKGDICCYIGSDDFYLPNAFSTVAQQFNSSNVFWLTGVPIVINKIGTVKASNEPCIYKSRYIRNGVYGTLLPHIQQESTFWKSELLEQLDLDRLRKYKYAGDYLIWHAFAKHHHLYTVDAHLAGFRIHEGNKSNNKIAYNEEFDGISSGSLSIMDFAIIYTIKYLFRLIGNGALKYSSKLLRLE